MSAFVRDGRGGNPAGVVLDAGPLPAARRARAAAALGFPETAFVEAAGPGVYRVEFFTPTVQVDLCGHATIAAFSWMAQSGRLPPGTVRQRTRAGELEVEVRPGGEVWMEQPRPVFGAFAEREEAARALGAAPRDLVGRPRVVSTGLPDLLVELGSPAALRGLRPDFAQVARLCRRLGALGVHAFALLRARAAAASCRNFAPGAGIPEEAATGTASGALACHLVERAKVLPRRAREGLTFWQGDGLGRPSEIRAEVETSGARIVGVRVGGRARFERRLGLD